MRATLRLAVGSAGLAVLAVLGILAACGSTDLRPIRNPPSVDASGGDDTSFAIDARDDRGASDAQTSDAGTTACKRGIASNGAPSSAFAPTASSPGVWWWYNWASQSPGGDPRIEFVPMIWGGMSLTQTIPAASRHLLGFNEPNFNNGQADLTSQQAAADWPAVEAIARGIPIASPSVNFCGSASDASACTDPSVTDPYTYLKDFFAACMGCRVDYTAVHAYDCDVPSLRDYIEGNTDAGGTLPGFVQFGKPIWVTEFSCDATHSVADQKAYMQAAVPYLESNPHVMRYAWFNAKPIPNGELVNADGSLNDLGATYVALPQSCP
jgi:hypothetical protein